MCVVTRIYVFEQVSCRIEPVRYPSRTNGFGSAERERRVPQVSRFSRPGRLCASLHCSLASVIPSPAKRSRGICGFRQPITDNRQPTPDNRQLLLEPEGRNNLSPGRKSWVGCSTNPKPASAATLYLLPPILSANSAHKDGRPLLKLVTRPKAISERNPSKEKRRFVAAFPRKLD